MSELLRRLKAEVLIFLTVYSGWLLYALTTDRYFQPIELDARTVAARMFYISLETYFVLLLVRLGMQGMKQDEDEEEK